METLEQRSVCRLDDHSETAQHLREHCGYNISITISAMGRAQAPGFNVHDQAMTKRTMVEAH
jgi:hypothetical protein